jgi:Peroxidase
LTPSTASASIFLDPAMYGDQELRVAAVDSLRERVRQAILRKPALAPSFYQLALLDGLSFNAKTQTGGPDGSVVLAVLSSKISDEYTKNLQEACEVLIEAGIALKKYTAITIGDAVAIAGAESLHSIGGPTLPVQLGRMEPSKKSAVSNTDISLFNGNATPEIINSVFKNAGLTEREMTTLLGGLLTLDVVQKTRSTDDWKASARPKFREPGKMGRMSDFKRLSDEDITAMEDGDEYDDGGEYIVDSFGTKDQAFGNRIGKEQIDEKSFNKFLQELNKNGKNGNVGWSGGYIADVLLDPSNPPTQAWLNKYAGSNLSYLKDLAIAFNSVTQLGAQFTGGKYEALLKNKPRKSLNNDDLGGIF